MIPGYYRIHNVPIALNELIRLLFSKGQAVQNKIRTTIPTTDNLEEGEFCWYKSTAGVIRLYVKIDGALAYIQFTNV